MTRLSLAVIIVLCGCRPEARTTTPEEDETIGPIQPKDPVEKAALLIKQGKLAEARNLIEAELVDHPENHELHYALGVVSRDQGRVDDALKSWQKALELEPDFQAALNGIGAVQLEAKDYDKAIATFSRAVEVDAGFAEAHYNLALALLGAGRKTDALAALENARRLTPDDLDVVLEIASVQLDLDRVDDAIATARSVVDRAPGDPRANAVYGRLLLDAGRPGEAVVPLRKAADAANDDGLRLTFAQALVRSGTEEHVAEAVTLLQRLTTGHDVALVWSEYAAALAKQGRFEEALKAAERAVVLDPSLGSGHVRKVGILVDLRRCKEAKAAVKDAERKAPKPAAAAARQAAARCK